MTMNPLNTNSRLRKALSKLEQWKPTPFQLIVLIIVGIVLMFALARYDMSMMDRLSRDGWF